MSEVAWRALERVARAMGAREGTGPEDDPLMRSHSAQVRAEGRAEGHREGVAQGHLNAVVQVLESRGIAVTLDAAEDRELVAGVPGDALMEAALACTDGADFRRRIGEQRAGSLSAGGPPSGPG